jgi:YjbR protein
VIRSSDDPPGLSELRELCLGFPSAEETVSHSGPKFRAGRVFAAYGAFDRDPTGEQRRVPSALVFTPDPVDLPAIDEDERFFVPVYHPGLRAIDLAGPHVDWSEVAELVDASYRQVASHRLVAALDRARDEAAPGEGGHGTGRPVAGSRPPDREGN